MNLKPNPVKLVVLITVLAGLLWVIADEVDDESATSSIVVTKTVVRQVVIDYGDDGLISTITATVSRTRDDGTGPIITKSGSRAFPRSDFTNDWPTVINQFEKTGAGRLRTFLFNNTGL